MEWKKICCGVDFSLPSRLAMFKAAELARQLEGELELVHVHTPPSDAGTDVLAAPVPVEDEGAMALVELENTIAMWRHEAERISGRPVRSTVVPGAPASELVRLARERPFDLVVLGTHGRRGLERLIIGPVAERVVREAPCCVLVVRRREPAEPGRRTGFADFVDYG